MLFSLTTFSSIWWSSLITPSRFPPWGDGVLQRLGHGELVLEAKKAAGKTPQPRQLCTGTTRHGDPTSNNPAPHSRDSTASHHGRKADFGEMGITPAQITPNWIVHGPSDTIKVRSTAGSWPKSLTPFSHWEGWGSAVKRGYSIFEGNTQPETYFSFYRRVNWP